MAIQDVLRRAGPYEWAESRSFPFQFKVFKVSDVAVTVSRDGVESVVDASDFSVSMNYDQNNNPGGTVVLDDAVAVADRVVITSDVPYTQEMVLTNQGGFYPSILNENSDRIVAQIQQLKEEVGRAIKVGVSSYVSADEYKASIEAVANDAAASADAAARSAASASAEASSARSLAASAEAASAEAMSLSGNAVETADRAADDAANALSAANTAVETSDRAIVDAGTALSNSQSAMTVSGKASADAAEAISTADTAIGQSAAAVADASAALSNSKSALAAANQASSDSSEALVAANAANAASSAAVSDASSALSAANAASADASDAKTDAKSALSTVTALQEGLPQDVSDEVTKQISYELENTVATVVREIAPPIIEETVGEDFAKKSDVSEAVAGEAALRAAEDAELSDAISFERNAREEADSALGERIENIGDNLADVATSGSYNDLKDKPVIPEDVSAFNNDVPYSPLDTVRCLVDDSMFSVNALGNAFTYGLFWLCIEIFDDTADVNTSVGAGGSIADYYDATNHLIVKTGTDSIVLQSKAKTCTKNNDSAWVSVDYEGSGSVDVEISRDGGTTFTACVNNLINDISVQPAGTSMVCKLTLNGEVTLKNVAWGCK